MRHEDNPTDRMHDFEAIALDPSSYDHETLLVAFRGGNIALAEGLMLGGDQAVAAVRRYDIPVEAIGAALAALNQLKQTSI